MTLSPRDLVHAVVLPFMRRIGDDWHEGQLSVAQEHLASAVLRSLLGAMARLYAREQPLRRLLFATPSGDRHEFGILAAAMLSAAGGLGTIYMGADLPARQIVEVATRAQVDVAVLGVVYVNRAKDLQRQIEHVADHLPPPAELWIGGVLPKELDQAIARRRAVRVPDFAALETHLQRLGARF